MTLDTADLRGLYETAVLVRRFEARIIELALAGRVPGSLHPGAGQEVAQLAALAALNPADKVLYAHRGVAYMVGRGIAPATILADLAGKEGGTNRGKGGIMHVVDVERGVLGESGTLGGGFVVSVGVGMALQHHRRGEVVAHFFGDGTANRGTFHEALNWAAARRLPCVYICENNGLAVSVPTAACTSVADIADRAAGYGIPGIVVDGADPAAVYDVTAQAVSRARSGDGPSLLEIKTTRLLGHWIGDNERYRTDPEGSQVDALDVLQQALVRQGELDETAITEVEQRAQSLIDEAIRVVDAAPKLRPEVALEDLYA